MSSGQRINMLVQITVAAFIAVAGAGLHAANRPAQPSTSDPCGLGPPPGTPEFATEQARQAVELASRGYFLVCEANLARFDISTSLQAPGVAMKRLAFAPVDLSATAFARLRLLGAATERPASRRKGDTMLYRSFDMGNGRTITLSEVDMSVEGIQTFRRPEDEPERINGLPARLAIFQTESGRAISFLSWKEGRRDLALWTNTNVALDNSRSELFALANAIPKSVPAQASEPELRPMSIGEDGMPDIEMPQRLTVEEVEESFRKEND